LTPEAVESVLAWEWHDEDYRGFPAGLAQWFTIGGHDMIKTMLLATAASFAIVSIAAAADLPRREPPPPYAAPVGKYPVGKYPVGKYPVGKYPQPVYTKG
jgi:hypothetical protein